MGLKVLITGICGFVGSVLARELAQRNGIDQVIGIDNFGRPGSETNRDRLRKLGIQVSAGDIRIESDVNALPKCDWVIDAAANASVLAGVDGRTSGRQLVEHNLFGTVNLLEYCRRFEAGLCLLSTSRVYSIEPLANLRVECVNEAFKPAEQNDLPLGLSTEGVSEQFSTSPPISLYGSTKVASEYLILEYGATFGFPVWINRCGVMAGAGQFGQPAQGIFAYWVHSFRERSPLRYIGFGGKGHQVRDCLHPRDLASLLLRQLTEPRSSTKPRLVNVSGGVESARSLFQMSSWCANRFGEMDITSDPEPRRFDIPWMVLDSSLCRQVWQWSPVFTTEMILEEIAIHAEQHPNWLSLSGHGK